MKKLVLVAGSLLLVSLLGACGSDDASTAKDLKDGSYKAEYEAFDDHGYKPTIEVTIKDGEITAVDYDELAEDGTKKSEDDSYGGGKMDPMPGEVYPQLEEAAVDAQSADVDTVSGATHSSDSFKALLGHVLSELAPKGTTSGTIK